MQFRVKVKNGVTCLSSKYWHGYNRVARLGLEKMGAGGEFPLLQYRSSCYTWAFLVYQKVQTGSGEPATASDLLATHDCIQTLPNEH